MAKMITHSSPLSSSPVHCSGHGNWPSSFSFLSALSAPIMFPRPLQILDSFSGQIEQIVDPFVSFIQITPVSARRSLEATFLLSLGGIGAAEALFLL